MKKPAIWVQSLSQLLKDNLLYVDKTKQIIDLITSWRYYFCSRPRRWWKSLAIDTMKEIFLGNKELFKGLYAYDNYKEWNKKYPVIVMSFAWYNKNTQKTLFQLMEDKTDIYIDGINYRISDFIEPNKLIDLYYLIEKIYKKTNQEVVVLIDEYDSPFTMNLNDEEGFFKIKNFFSDFYSSIKDKSRYLRFFYLSWLTKVWQTNLFSAMNHLDNITFVEKYNDLIWYTLQEVKLNFKEHILLTCQKLHLQEEELLKELKEWYDWYYFGDSNNRLYNPRSINCFFKKWEFSDYWRETWTSSIINNIFIKPTTIEIINFLTNTLNENFDIDLWNLSIDSLNNVKPASLLLQSWYLTIKDKETNEVRIANKEAKNALFIDFKDYIRERKELENYVKNLNILYDRIITKDEKWLEKVLNDIEEDNNPASEWFNRNPEWYFKGGLEWNLRLAWFNIITREEANKNGRCDLVIYHHNEVYIIEAKIWWQKEAEETAINQIDEKYASSYKYKNLIKIWIAWDKNKDKKVYVKIIKKQ